MCMYPCTKNLFSGGWGSGQSGAPRNLYSFSMYCYLINSDTVERLMCFWQNTFMADYCTLKTQDTSTILGFLALCNSNSSKNIASACYIVILGNTIHSEISTLIKGFSSFCCFIFMAVLVLRLLPTQAPVVYTPSFKKT